MHVEIAEHRAAKAAIPPELLKRLLSDLRSLKIDFSKAGSRKARKTILEKLVLGGWSKSVRIEAGSGISVTAMNSGIALSLQFGNMGRFYADLLKLQHLHAKARADAAIYVLPTKKAAASFGSNIAHFERLRKEVAIFHETITVPICILGIEGDKS